MKSLFEPLQLGDVEIQNRVIMAPMTRNRANAQGILPSVAGKYYSQRASAGLIISEATAVSRQGSGYPSIPGLWTDRQAQAWKEIISEVHHKGGKIFIQLYHTGRIAHSSLVNELPVSASAVTRKGEVTTSLGERVAYETPRALQRDEIQQVVEDFTQAATRAIVAGSDGIEIHAANGYLIDQFLRDGTNHRHDEYGGSAENRARFLIEVVHAVVAAVGAGRVGVRFAPENQFNEMHDSDPMKTFTAAAGALSRFNLAYMHIVETVSTNEKNQRVQNQISSSMQHAFQGKTILNRGFNFETASEFIEKKHASAIAFGIPFISNPDLAQRFRRGIPLAHADSTTFYSGGEKGYIDYAFSE